MESTAIDESECEEAPIKKPSTRYSNIALGPEHETVKTSGRRKNKIKRKPVTELQDPASLFSGT